MKLNLWLNSEQTDWIIANKGDKSVARYITEMIDQQIKNYESMEDYNETDTIPIDKDNLQS